MTGIRPTASDSAYARKSRAEEDRMLPYRRQEWEQNARYATQNPLDEGYGEDFDREWWERVAQLQAEQDVGRMRGPGWESWKRQSMDDFYGRQRDAMRAPADASATPGIDQLMRPRRRFPKLAAEMDREYPYGGMYDQPEEAVGRRAEMVEGRMLAQGGSRPPTDPYNPEAMQYGFHRDRQRSLAAGGEDVRQHWRDTDTVERLLEEEFRKGREGMNPAFLELERRNRPRR